WCSSARVGRSAPKRFLRTFTSMRAWMKRAIKTRRSRTHHLDFVAVLLYRWEIQQCIAGVSGGRQVLERSPQRYRSATFLGSWHYAQRRNNGRSGTQVDCNTLSIIPRRSSLLFFEL